MDYSDIWSRVLPINASHFNQWVIATSTKDFETQELVQKFGPPLDLFVTDDFYARGAWFNKGVVINAMLNYIDCDEWILCLDADILMPRFIGRIKLNRGNLYGATRRLCERPMTWDGSMNWTRFPVIGDVELGGFFHLFHSSDPVVQARPAPCAQRRKR